MKKIPDEEEINWKKISSTEKFPKQLIGKKLDTPRCKCGKIAEYEIFSELQRTGFYCTKCYKKLGAVKEISTIEFPPLNLQSFFIVPAFGTGSQSFSGFGKEYKKLCERTRNYKKFISNIDFYNIQEDIEIIFNAGDKCDYITGDAHLILIKYGEYDVIFTKLGTPLYIIEKEKIVYYFE